MFCRMEENEGRKAMSMLLSVGGLVFQPNSALQIIGVFQGKLFVLWWGAVREYNGNIPVSPANVRKYESPERVCVCVYMHGNIMFVRTRKNQSVVQIHDPVGILS